MPRTISIAIASILLATLVTVAHGLWMNPTQSLQAGILVVLAITLIVLIRYAWDTSRIAKSTEEKWAEELKPKVVYEMVLAHPERREDRVLFRLTNPSNYFVEAKVNCNFKVYGEPVSYGGPYDGTDAWLLFPHQMSQGWYSLSTLVARQDKTLDEMVRERNEDNKAEQLICDLEIDFTSETGYSRRYPKRRHYFDFEERKWIPVLTIRE